MESTVTVGMREPSTVYEARYDDAVSSLLGSGTSAVRSAVDLEIGLRRDSRVQWMAFPRDRADAAQGTVDADMGRVGRVGRIRTYIGIARNAVAGFLAILLLSWAEESWLPYWAWFAGIFVVAQFTNLKTGGSRHEVETRDRWILAPFGLAGLTDLVCAHAETVVVGRRFLYVGQLEVRRDSRGVASFHPVVRTYPGDALAPVTEGQGPVVLRERSGRPIVTMERLGPHDLKALEGLAQADRAIPQA